MARPLAPAHALGSGLVPGLAPPFTYKPLLVQSFVPSASRCRSASLLAGDISLAVAANLSAHCFLGDTLRRAGRDQLAHPNLRLDDDLYPVSRTRPGLPRLPLGPCRYPPSQGVVPCLLVDRVVLLR